MLKVIKQLKEPQNNSKVSQYHYGSIFQKLLSQNTVSTGTRHLRYIRLNVTVISKNLISPPANQALQVCILKLFASSCKSHSVNLIAGTEGIYLAIRQSENASFLISALRKLESYCRKLTKYRHTSEILQVQVQITAIK